MNQNYEDIIGNKIAACKSCLAKRDIPALQNSLLSLYREFNHRGEGMKIINYPQKDELCECFTMMLNYNLTDDPDILEVFAENGFYCIVECLCRTRDATQFREFTEVYDLFLLLIVGEKPLLRRFDNILSNARKKREFNIPSFIEDLTFTSKDFDNDASYMIRQFKYYAATYLSNWEKDNPNCISPSLRMYYETAKSDSDFLKVPLDSILDKMVFFAHIFGQILLEF